MARAEFDLIAQIRARVTQRDDVILGIGDDAALLRVPDGSELVVAMDTLNAGVHFPHDTDPAAIGWKALAVNLSDLAAMAALPAWCTLSLSLPEGDAVWLEAFLDGFLALAAQHAVALVGGDTTRGPLSICVAAHGFVRAGQALCRDGARIGDDIWITGTPGDAAAALAQWRLGAPVDATLRARLDRPVPRVDIGRALAGIAHACIDVSDGLLADLGHLCTASAVGAEVMIDEVPVSEPLRRAVDAARRRELQANGGDDYELCFTAPADARAAIVAVGISTQVAITRIGRIVAGSAVTAFDAQGDIWVPTDAGFSHF